jgi:hypothetical protein
VELPQITTRQEYRALPQISGDQVEQPSYKLVLFAFACPNGCEQAATQGLLEAGARPQCPTHNRQMMPIGTVYSSPSGFVRFAG